MTMHIEHRNSNLFVKLSGDFNQASACAAVSVMADQYNGTGNIFVNVVKIGTVQPSAPTEFRKCLASSDLPVQKIYLIGKKGYEISSGDFRVIIPPERKCSGKCHACSQKSKPRQQQIC